MLTPSARAKERSGRQDGNVELNENNMNRSLGVKLREELKKMETNNISRRSR